jgi:4-hydroxy-4-methyl-2-oxoglutarate aldolase
MNVQTSQLLNSDIVIGYRKLLAYFSPSCLVCDAQKRRGVLGPGFFAVGGHKIAGTAFTISLEVSSLVDTIKSLELVRPGDIIVIASHGDLNTAMWGGMTSLLSKHLGVAGAVIDGAIRDIDEIRSLGFPVWGRATVPRPSPTLVHGRNDPLQINVPVVVSGLLVSPGDIVVADETGIAVVPHADAEQVLQAALAQARKEEEIRLRVESGVPALDIIREFGHI